jgi:molybdopterin synthase catalytic subunit
MKVRLLMFGALSATTGVHEQYLELPDDATAGSVLQWVAAEYPEAGPILGRVSVAVNLETTGFDQVLAPDDEVALLPPVAGGAGDLGGGGSAKITTGVRSEAVSIDEVMDLVADPAAGGTVVFVGTVRERSEGWGDVDQLSYSIYLEMAEPMLRRVAEEAAERWPLNGVCILHRVGDLPVGAQTVIVACSAPHRQEAFEAARYGIDEVKRRVPVWKKEIGPGGDRWIGIEGVAEPAEPAEAPS